VKRIFASPFVATIFKFRSTRFAAVPPPEKPEITGRRGHPFPRISLRRLFIVPRRRPFVGALGMV